MTKQILIFQLFLVWTISACGQNNPKTLQLIRKHIDKDSSWIVDETEFHFMSSAGMKKNHFGWFSMTDLIQKNCDLLYFEANTIGSMRIVIELPKNIKSIKLDTLSIDKFQLINHHYGNLRRDFEEKNNTIDILTGTLNFNQTSDNEIEINGKINIDSKKPTTHQEITFDTHKAKIQTLSKILEIEKQQKIEIKKQEKIEAVAYVLVENERAKFYNSTFNLNKYPKNNIKATLNRKLYFDFKLDNSYILENASLTDSAKQDLTELLGGNILASVQGNKKVFTFHSFHDPEKNTIDDETNYSLSIEFNSIVSGKSYKVDSKNKDIVAKLAFWHFGPSGTVITLKEVIGTIVIIRDDNSKTNGTLNLTFKNIDKTTINLTGDFELPKLKLSEITDLEDRIKVKLKKYYEEN